MVIDSNSQNMGEIFLRSSSFLRSSGDFAALSTVEATTQRSYDYSILLCRAYVALFWQGVALLEKINGIDIGLGISH
jgi:hypothetical protein